MLPIIHRIKKWATAAPKAFWIGLVALLTWLVLHAKLTASEVVSIHKKRRKVQDREAKRNQQIQESLERQKKKIEAEKEELQTETMEAQKELTDAASSMEKTAQLANSVFKE